VKTLKTSQEEYSTNSALCRLVALRCT